MNCLFSAPHKVKDIAKNGRFLNVNYPQSNAQVHFVNHNKDVSLARFTGEVLKDGYHGFRKYMTLRAK